MEYHSYWEAYIGVQIFNKFPVAVSTFFLLRQHKFIHTKSFLFTALSYMRRLFINPLNAELNPIRHFLALAGGRHFVDVSRIRVKSVLKPIAIKM
jgi:hypothetical protein